MTLSLLERHVAECGPETLRALLEPLRSPADAPPTWLTKAARFLNRLLEG